MQKCLLIYKSVDKTFIVLLLDICPIARHVKGTDLYCEIEKFMEVHNLSALKIIICCISETS